MSTKATNASTGRGATLSYSVDGTTFNPIAGVKSVSFTSPKINFDSTTTLGSLNAIEEFIATTTDPGSLMATLVWDQSDLSQAAIAGLFYAHTPVTLQLAYPAQQNLKTGPVVTVYGWFSENGIAGADLSKAAEFQVGFKISGQINFTAAS